MTDISTLENTLNERLQKVLADIVYQMIGEGEAAEGDRARIEQSLIDGADSLLQAFPKLLQEFRPLFERSLGASPGDRRAGWRTEMHSVMLAHSSSSAGFATLVDDLAMKGMAKADSEHEMLTLALTATQEHANNMERLASQKNTWFTEGADFTPPPPHTMPSIAQTWASLLASDPDDRLEELQRLMTDGEGRLLR